MVGGFCYYHRITTWCVVVALALGLFRGDAGQQAAFARLLNPFGNDRSPVEETGKAAEEVLPGTPRHRARSHLPAGMAAPCRFLRQPPLSQSQFVSLSASRSTQRLAAEFALPLRC